MTRKGMLKTLSIVDIKGSAATGNRGLIDLLLLKQNMRRVLLTKGQELFGATAHAWIDGKVATHTESFRAWFQQEEDAG